MWRAAGQVVATEDVPLGENLILSTAFEDGKDPLGHEFGSPAVRSVMTGRLETAELVAVSSWSGFAADHQRASNPESVDHSRLLCRDGKRTPMRPDPGGGSGAHRSALTLAGERPTADSEAVNSRSTLDEDDLTQPRYDFARFAARSTAYSQPSCMNSSQPLLWCRLHTGNFFSLTVTFEATSRWHRTAPAVRAGSGPCTS